MLRTGEAGVPKFGVGVTGAVGATGNSGIFKLGTVISLSGTIGSGAGGKGPGKGPTGSPSSPVSPSGIEDGAATGSEKTGSTLVVLVISSIAFCKSLSIV